VHFLASGRAFHPLQLCPGSGQDNGAFYYPYILTSIKSRFRGRIGARARVQENTRPAQETAHTRQFRAIFAGYISAVKTRYFPLFPCKILYFHGFGWKINGNW
jgi:hypothetical protein